MSLSVIGQKTNAEEITNFIVTAYYSPLPNQEYYLKGNYESEIKLNGRGIKGASGLGVFNGMLAGPKKYPFGTKIYLEGIGTGIIADRGGAIVEAGERGYDTDRIDVWMGYGDDGLKKALSWGKRKVNGKVVSMGENTISSTEGVKLNFSVGSINKSSLVKTSNEEIYKINVGPDSNKEKIKKLQTKIKEIGLYKGSIDGKYNQELQNILIKFQIENSIIKTSNDYGAGYWGAKTREKFVNKEKELTINKTKINISNNNQQQKILLPKDIFNTYISSKSKIEDIKNLQIKLKEMALYNGNINGKYNEIQNIVLNFQLDNNIIKNKNDIGAGTFGPKTLESLKNNYAFFINKKEIAERDRRKMEEIKNLALKQANEYTDKIGNPKSGEKSQNVRELQKVLTTLGYFEGKDTAIYGDKTKNSLIKFQKDNKLVLKESDPGAGKVGNKTKEILKKELAKLLVEKRLNEDKAVAMNYKK